MDSFHFQCLFHNHFQSFNTMKLTPGLCGHILLFFLFITLMQKSFFHSVFYITNKKSCWFLICILFWTLVPLNLTKWCIIFYQNNENTKRTCDGIIENALLSFSPPYSVILRKYIIVKEL
jgi:hypothetical protein